MTSNRCRKDDLVVSNDIYKVLEEATTEMWEGYRDIEEGGVKSIWAMEIQHIMREIGITHEGQRVKQWKRLVKSKVKKWDIEQWSKDREGNQKLCGYPKKELDQREGYLNFTKTSMAFCKARIGDMKPLTEMTTCHKCGDEVGEWRQHILLDCEDGNMIRERKGWIGGEGVKASKEWWEGVLGEPSNRWLVSELWESWIIGAEGQITGIRRE